MTYPDPNLDWVALLEAQGAGPEKYHMHASAHQMACQKYVVAAKQAKVSGNSKRASLLRKIGNKHKAAADALLAIANHHTDALYGIQLQKKAQLMPKKQPVNEETLEDIVLEDQEIELEEDIVEEIEEDNRVRDLIAYVLQEKALDFQKTMFSLMEDMIAVELETLQEAIAEGVAADSDGSDEDDEEDSKDSPEIQGEDYRYAETEPGPLGSKTVPAMGQEKLAEPGGKRFPERTPAQPMHKIGQKNKSQKGTTKASGNDKRENEAAD